MVKKMGRYLTGTFSNYSGEIVGPTLFNDLLVQ